MTKYFALFAIVFGACGPSVSGDDDDDGRGDAGTGEPGSLRIDPGDVTLRIENATPATQAYTVIFTDEDGDEIDVTDEAQLSLGLPSLGTFSGSTLTTTTDRAGRTTVRASWDGNNAESQLTVMLTHIVVTGDAPADSRDRFQGATGGGAAPSIVYPNPGIIVPPNMNTLELHYMPGAGNDLFEIAFVGSLVELVVYTTCDPLGGGCLFDPDEDTWAVLAESARGDAPVFYTVTGLAQASNTKGTSGSQAITFAQDELLGGIYYWAAGQGAIMRYDFGRRGQTAERFLGVAETGATQCVGCHALSRDGSQIAVGLDIPGPATVETYEVGTRTLGWSTSSGGIPIPGGEGANFFSFSPDNTQLLMSDSTELVLVDAADGSGAQSVVSGASMPDWAANGTDVAFARPNPVPPLAAPGIGGGSIVVTQAGNWGNQTTVAPAGGGNNYYPSFTPDSEWVVYNRSMGDDSFDAADAQVWIVSASGGAAPIKLANASPDPGGDSWPKVAPFIHSYVDGQVTWLTFSSRRAYGLRGGGTSQIWMVGIDPAKAANGDDPSFAAFWLPFQDPASGNHIAQWVEEIDRQPCDIDEECATGEFCEDGVCVPWVE